VRISAFNATIQNIILYLAIKQNFAIENELRAKVNSQNGFSMLISYVYSNKVAFSQSSFQ
jgi:hypothetical protein